MRALLTPLCVAGGIGVAGGVGLGGCATYVTPAGPADLGPMVAPSISERLAASPQAPLPATIAYARVQDSGYRSFSSVGSDRGNLSMIGPDDLELPPDLERINSWPMVTATVRLTPIIVPSGNNPILCLRERAASLRADVVLLYTLDTRFDVDQVNFGPLGVVTLGFVPNRSAVVRSTASAAFIDGRSGFCYDTCEASAKDDQLANHWTTDQAIDDCRRRVEREAFEAMPTRCSEVWTAFVASRPPQSPTPPTPNP